MNHLRTLAFAALCGAGLASPASAALIQVSSLGTAVDYATLTGAAGTSFAAGTVLSNASAAGTIRVSSTLNNIERNDQTTFNDNNFPSSTQFFNQCGYSGLFTCNSSGAVTVSFAVPTAGFTVSADDFDTTAAYTFTANVFNGSTLLGTISATSLANNGASPAVLAALSTTPITSVQITDPTGNFVLADIGAVPEPASVALLGTGLLGLLGLRRRR